MAQKQNKLTQTGIVALLACVCCILWGSAIPVIKTGYHLLQVDSSDTASQIVFAGIRFTLAGILVLIFASIKEKKLMLPDRELFKYAVPVCLAQTVGQYFFFYIGVAHTSGVKGGIITGLGNFIAILLSCLVFRNERMTSRKIAGCILGFAGVVVINLMGNSLDMGFQLIGEGFILIAQLSYGISTVLINLFSKKDTVVKKLSGGMKRRLGIAQALIGNPDIVLLDEPTAGLDPEERLNFKNVVREIKKDRCVVLSTHIITDIESLCDKILILSNGAITQFNSCDELANVANGKVFAVNSTDNIDAPFYSMGTIYIDGKTYEKVICLNKIDALPLAPTVEDGYICFIENLS